MEGIEQLRKENAYLLRQWDLQIQGDLKARKTLTDQLDRLEAELALLKRERS